MQKDERSSQNMVQVRYADLYGISAMLKYRTIAIYLWFP